VYEELRAALTITDIRLVDVPVSWDPRFGGEPDAEADSLVNIVGGFNPLEEARTLPVHSCDGPHN